MGTSIITQLSSALTGRVLAPDDPGYDTARSLFNSMIDVRPAAIAQVSGAQDAAAALRIAREAGLPISVKGGGHGVTGSALCEGIVIDLAHLRSVTVDPEARTATAGGGSTWSDFDTATQQHQLATPGGRVTHTGIAGLTLGGGQGWLSPKHGMSCDNLIAAEVVTADGSIVTASAQENPELLWGLRGGGGNFGVVTSFTYQVHPLGPLFQGGLLAHPLERAPEVVPFYVDFVRRHPGTFGGALVFMSTPPAPGVPPEAIGAPMVGIVAAWFDSDLEAGERALQPLREFGPPLLDLIGPMPYVALQSMIDDGNEPGRRNHWCASYTSDLPAPLVTALMEATASKPSLHTHVVVGQMGEAVNAVDEDATAFPNRDGTWLFHPLSVWTDPGDDAINRQWARDLNAKAAPYATAGAYINVDADATERSARSAFGDQKAARLAALKKAWDPDGVFRPSVKIPPIDVVPQQERAEPAPQTPAV